MNGSQQNVAADKVIIDLAFVDHSLLETVTQWSTARRHCVRVNVQRPMVRRGCDVNLIAEYMG